MVAHNPDDEENAKILERMVNICYAEMYAESVITGVPMPETDDEIKEWIQRKIVREEQE